MRLFRVRLAREIASLVGLIALVCAVAARSSRPALANGTMRIVAPAVVLALSLAPIGVGVVGMRIGESRAEAAVATPGLTAGTEPCCSKRVTRRRAGASPSARARPRCRCSCSGVALAIGLIRKPAQPRARRSAASEHEPRAPRLDDLTRRGVDEPAHRELARHHHDRRARSAARAEHDVPQRRRDAVIDARIDEVVVEVVQARPSPVGSDPGCTCNSQCDSS
jgi:hypothetical protein